MHGAEAWQGFFSIFFLFKSYVRLNGARHGIFQFEMTLAAGEGKSRMKPNVRFIPVVGRNRGGEKLRSAPMARRTGKACLLPL